MENLIVAIIPNPEFNPELTQVHSDQSTGLIDFSESISISIR